MKWGAKLAWTAVWVAWLAAFVALEFYAVGNPQPGDTLSETIWVAMDRWVVVRVSVWLLLGWLVKHFTWDWYRRRGR